MEHSFEERLAGIPWPDFDTAYGPAVEVPDQLRRLAGADRTTALTACHDLWCGLCHQHVQLGSAALPALPFLLEVLERDERDDCDDRDLAVELLDILLGFALGVQRVAKTQSSRGRCRVEPEPPWVTRLRAGLLAELPRFRRLAGEPDQEIAGFAEQIVAELAEAAQPGPKP